MGREDTVAFLKKALQKTLSMGLDKNCKRKGVAKAGTALATAPKVP